MPPQRWGISLSGPSPDVKPGSVGVAPRHLAFDHALHDEVLLDPAPELVRLGGVEVDVLLELEAELAAEHAGVIQISAEEDLVHAPQMLLVEQILVSQQLPIDIDLGALERDGRDDRVVGHCGESSR